MAKRFKARKENWLGFSGPEIAMVFIAFVIIAAVFAFALVESRISSDDEKNGNEPTGKVVKTVPDWLQR